VRTGAAAGHRGYFHETAFYSSDEEFLAIVVPFLEGSDAGDVEPPTTDTSSAGLGLWLAHQMSPHVALSRTDDGFTIRLTAGVLDLTS
jgi:hypothetical protein